MQDEPTSAGKLRVGFVPGVTTTKWSRIWAERHPRARLEVVAVPQAEQRAQLNDGSLEMCFVREPLDIEGLHLIPLYEEAAVLVVPRDHPATVVEPVRLVDLDQENVLEPGDSAVQLDEAFDAVAAGVGVLVVPQPIARTHSRRDLSAVPVIDAPPTRVGLAWRVDHANPWIEDFIGIVRGRTVNSSRGATSVPARRGAR